MLKRTEIKKLYTIIVFLETIHIIQYTLGRTSKNGPIQSKMNSKKKHETIDAI
jgi:hypothetical protein